MSLRQDDAIAHSARSTQAFLQAAENTGDYISSEEVEVAIHEELRCKSLVSTAPEILNMCQDATNRSINFGIVLKNNGILVD